MTRSSSRYLLALPLLLLGISGARPSAQQPADATRPVNSTPAVTFRVEVNYVEVDAAVFEQGGTVRQRPQARGLRGARGRAAAGRDRLQPREHPDRARRPAALRGARRSSPTWRPTRRPFDGRLYVMVLDDLHTGATRTQLRAQGRAAVHRAAHGRQRPRGGRPHQRPQRRQPGVHEQQAAARRQHRQVHGPEAAVADARAPRRVPAAAGDPDRSERHRHQERRRPARRRARLRRRAGRCARSRTSRNWVGSIRGRRKAIVFVSEGIDYDIYDFQKRETTTVQDAMREVIATATRSNVSIYSVDPRGLTSHGRRVDRGDRRVPRRPAGAPQHESFHDELRLAQQSLRSLVGGHRRLRLGQQQRLHQRVDAGRRGQQLLLRARLLPEERQARRPIPQDRGQGEARGRGGPLAQGLHGAEGQSRRRRSRRPSDKASPELRQVLDSPLPLSGLTMRVFAAPFKGAAPNASVAIGVEAEGARPATSPRRTASSSTTSSCRSSRSTQPARCKDGDRSLLNMGLKPETRARVAQTGLRMQTRLKLPPGRYQLRIGARETGGGRLGSVNYDIDRPRLHRRAAHDERGRAGVGLDPVDDDGQARRGTAHSAARAGDRLARVPDRRHARHLRRGLRQRPPASPTRSTSRRPCSATTARRCSRPARNETSTRTAGEARRVRPHRAGAAQGVRAGALRAAGGGHLAIGQGRDRDARRSPSGDGGASSKTGYASSGTGS